jgi:predicted nucleic acid-binding protein
VRFVLDASVTMSWLLEDAGISDQAYAASVLESLQQPESRALVPVTWSLEVANVLARSEAKRLISGAQSNAFLALLDELEIEVDAQTHARAFTTTLQLARRHHLSSYDASYLELAERTALPLASLDRDLLKSAKKAGVDRFVA